MKNFCTLSDYNYLPLGLSLYESLKKTTKGGFNLYYLCLDDKTFDTLEKFDIPFDEIYFDARDEKKLIWYGGMFQMVRSDLSKDFEKVRVESGWEIWRRIPHLN